MRSTTGGPMVRLGTKWPSITSTWCQSAPAASIPASSSARRAKSAESSDGAMRRGWSFLGMTVRATCSPFSTCGMGGDSMLGARPSPGAARAGRSLALPAVQIPYGGSGPGRLPGQQGLDPGQGLARQELERGSPAGRDVLDLLAHAEELDRSDRVASADDRVALAL